MKCDSEGLKERVFLMVGDILHCIKGIKETQNKPMETTRLFIIQIHMMEIGEGGGFAKCPGY